MTYEFKLPDIGEGVVEGEVVRWLVKEGDSLREDQPMVEIMTDKATVEIPAPRAGRVAKRMYAEGQLCPVGKVETLPANALPGRYFIRLNEADVVRNGTRTVAVRGRRWS